MQLHYTPLFAIPRSIGLYLRGRVQFQTAHLGDVVTREDGRPFKVFREVIISPQVGDPERPSGIFRVWFYAKGSAKFTQTLAWGTTLFFFGLPGFRHKLWLVDEATGEFGGIYEWNTLQDAEAYAHSYAMKLSALRSVPGKFSMDVLPPADMRAQVAMPMLL